MGTHRFAKVMRQVGPLWVVENTVVFAFGAPRLRDHVHHAVLTGHLERQGSGQRARQKPQGLSPTRSPPTQGLGWFPPSYRIDETPPDILWWRKHGRAAKAGTSFPRETRVLTVACQVPSQWLPRQGLHHLTGPTWDR